MSEPEAYLARRIRQMGGSAVSEMLDLGRKLAAEGREIIPLVQGEPDFDTPGHIKEAAHQALLEGHTHYIPAQGLLRLREAIAAKLARENNIQADPGSEIIITTGGTLGLHLVMLAILEPGDEVLVPEPSYGPFQGTVEMGGGICRFVPMTDVDGHFRLSEAALQEAITPRTKAIIICSPNNPTGDVMRLDEFQAVARVAEQHGILVITDELYEKLVYEGHTHHSFLGLYPELKDQIVVLNAFSKTYAMTGWRLGYTVASRPLVSAMTKVNQFSGRMAASFVQYAGVAALEGPQDFVDQMLNSYRARCDLLLSGLAAIPGLKASPPEGTFYVFADARQTGLDSWALARCLLETGGVITSPGAYYGPSGEGYLRLSYAYHEQQLQKGIAGLRRGFEHALQHGATP
jgi:aspartate aminotransferase